MGCNDKRGDISVGRTPDTEGVLSTGEKCGGDKEAVERLDDDAFHRLADAVADKHDRLHKRLAK
jgi:hypothetical protein